MKFSLLHKLYLVVLLTPMLIFTSVSSASPRSGTLQRSKQSKGRVSPSATKTSKPRRLYLNFTDSQTRSTIPPITDDSDLQTPQHKPNETLVTKPKTSSRIKLSPGLSAEKVGFTSVVFLGYSNSAYRYAGEDYPAKNLDFGISPSLDASCFSFRCSYFLRAAGIYDLHTEGKSELSLFQFGLRVPGNPWAQALTPSLSIFGFLPTTQRELETQKSLYSFGGSVSLSTTPELMGTNFIGFTAIVSARRNVHEQQTPDVQLWATRQALSSNFNFTKTLTGSLIVGHIFGENYDGTSSELLELGQSISWQTNEWLNLSLGHNNSGPMFNTAGDRMDTSLVSIDNSVISLSLSLTNSF